MSLETQGHSHSQSQPNLWDSVAAARLRDEGIAAAAGKKGVNALLVYAREGAREIALSRPNRTCTADDVQRWLMRKGFDETALGNASGSVFREKCWEHIGWTTSERVSAHSRGIRIWRYVGAGV